MPFERLKRDLLVIPLDRYFKYTESDLKINYQHYDKNKADSSGWTRPNPSPSGYYYCEEEVNLGDDTTEEEMLEDEKLNELVNMTHSKSMG